MRLALLADIHGNYPALQAVMAELERLQPDYVLLNGDLINCIPFSAEVVDTVRKTDWTVVRGNHEFYYLDFVCGRAPEEYGDPGRWGQLHWLVEQIGIERGAYLGMLPDDITLHLPAKQTIRMTHGVPGRNRVGFQPFHKDEEIATELHEVQENTLLSAHSHQQVDRIIPVNRQKGGASTSCHVVNPGSIGLPLNQDTTAQFAIAESVPHHEVFGGWRITFHRLQYDRRPALEAFFTSGMLEAGGAMSQLFYWQLVTADHEVVKFWRWAHQHGHNPDVDLDSSFAAYNAATGRKSYIQQRDPLIKKL